MKTLSSGSSSGSTTSTSKSCSIHHLLCYFEYNAMPPFWLGLCKWGRKDAWRGPGLTTNSIIFCSFFCEKSLICLEGKSMTPYRGNPIFLHSSQQTPSSLSRALLLDLQRYKDTVRCAARARRSQDAVKNSWRKPWLCVCWKHTFLHRSLIVKSHQNRIELVTRLES